MGNEATAFTLDNLNPDTKYDIYVGGVQSSGKTITHTHSKILV